jgi:hypothetical protein
MADGNGDGSGGANTVLLVVLLLLVVGFGVWWFTTHRGTAPNNGINVNVTMPSTSPKSGY